MLIAEIGNNHFGSYRDAMELIRVAHECGADIVKSQAFKDLKHGSMDKEFYKQCEFTFNQYVDLIYYARDIGSDLFYSIFSPELEELKEYQNWEKVAGVQYRNGVEILDRGHVLVSIPLNCKLRPLTQAEVMHVTDYMTDNPMLEHIEFLSKFYKRQAGYSDHSLGIGNCVRAVKEYGCVIVEKHFTLEKNKLGFRDTIHGADPKELEQLALAMKG